MGNAMKGVGLARSATSLGHSTIPTSPCSAPSASWLVSPDLRVGYGAFPDWLLPQLWKIKQPYNVNVAATLAAIASLEDIATLQDNLGKLIAERERMSEALSEFDFLQPYPSHSNFILCRVLDRDARQLKLALEAAGNSGALLRQTRPARLHPHQRG